MTDLSKTFSKEAGQKNLTTKKKKKKVMTLLFEVVNDRVIAF